MSNKQTALDFLLTELDIAKIISKEKLIIAGEIVRQAKEMEKEQHQETFKQSRQAKIFEKDMPALWECWEQYYHETFGK